jgi:hypothetical protein
MAYSSTQLDYAKQIVTVGQQMGMTPQDIKTALAVALDESELQNYANSKIPFSLALPHDNVGSDGNSVGIFQQQVGIWGDTTSLMNPDTEIRKFYTALRNVPGRDSMSIPQAAQTVQQSADPTGSNYAAKVPEAQALYNLVSNDKSSASSPSGGNWFANHGGWKRLGVYVVGGGLLLLAFSIWLGESKGFKDAMKLGVKAGELAV